MAVVCVAAIAFVPLGCGADGESPEEAEAALTAYLSALREGDAEGVCDLIAEATIADLGSATSCERVFESGFSLGREHGSKLPEFEIEAVAVDGDSATATLVSAGADQEVELVREEGEWKLAGATAFSQFHPDSPTEP